MTSLRAKNMEIAKVSQLKGQLQTIIANIGELERLTANIEGAANAADVDKLQQRTNDLLGQVERAPLERIVRRVEKRKRERQSKKVANLIKKRRRNETCATVVPTATAATVPQAVEAAAASENAAVSTSAATSQSETIKPHQQLRNYHDAQRFLRTFELLKMLHLARGQDGEATREFAAQFNNLSATWNSVLQENAPQRTQARRIEDQWDEVLFGPKERVYYGSSGEHKMGDLLRVRRIWDSYLTRSKHGTHIPTGWVLPSENATTAWQQYRAN